MSGSKFNQLHVYIIGVVLMIIVGAGMYFLLIKPILEENAGLRASIANTEQTQVTVDTAPFTIAQKSSADEALKVAMARRDRNRASLMALLSRKRLPASQTINFGPDASSASQDFVIANTLPKWLQLPKALITTMERYAQRTARKHRVQVVTNFSAPAQSTYIWGIPRDIIAKRLGNMAITGRFNDVMAWAEDWNNAPLLASVEGLNCTVAGAKGVISATASLNVYVFPEGALAEQEIAKATTGTGTGGGGMGGMMGGMMGGGMMGGMSGMSGPGAGMRGAGMMGATTAPAGGGGGMPSKQ